ncbi:hypothetical protein P3T73_07000 [Kiritimatiellota bacterium B12222]|nr:hypothetical protein P3T73_07000 [Kiritimatiellota bacterium B12222]
MRITPLMLFIFLVGCVHAPPKKAQTQPKTDFSQSIQITFILNEDDKQIQCVLRKLNELSKSDEALTAHGINIKDVEHLVTRYDEHLKERFILKERENEILESFCELFQLEFSEFRNECENLPNFWVETRYLPAP